MTLVLDFAAAISIILLAWLLLLVLFERGPSYRMSGPIHQLDDDRRLRLLSSILSAPVQSIRSLEVLREGSALYERQLAAIGGARRSIHLETYIFRPGQYANAFVDALCERASAGVSVRVIVDAVGSFAMSKVHLRAIAAAGGQVYRYHPLTWRKMRRWNSRTHRNLLLVDDEVGFVGGAGIADHWARSEPPPWRDCVVRVTGSVVAGLQAVFAENWLECAGELLIIAQAADVDEPDPAEAEHLLGVVVGSTPTAGGSTRARILVQCLLASARERIELCSPYFVPDLGIRRELIAAQERGVQIRILTGGPYSDHGIVRRAGRRRYGPLLAAGIEIHEFASHMLHTKVLIVDGRWSLVGSTNIDHRSFGLNDEVNLLVIGPGVAQDLLLSFERDLEQSERVNLTSWLGRSWGERVLAALGRIIERHQ